MLTVDLMGVKWLAVLAAGIAAVVIGGLWYAPFLFGKAWQKALGWSDEQMKEAQKGAAPGYVVAVVGALVTAWVFALAVKAFGATTAGDAIEVAALLWLGFSLAQAAIGTMFEKRSWSLFGINVVNQLVNMVVMALILTLWT